MSTKVGYFQSRLLAPTGAILRDLTTSITKGGSHPVARGGFGEIWKCTYQTDQGPINVRCHFFY